MDKLLAANQKIRANKQQQPKNKKKQQQPIKVVYITNPIKINATPSEFRALVQELTGHDADFSDTARFVVAAGGGSATADGKVAAAVASEEEEEINTHSAEEVVTKLGRTCDGGEEEVVGNGSDPIPTFGSYFDDDDDAFATAKMMENYPGLMASGRCFDGLMFKLN